MPILPRPGSATWYRQRKSWLSSPADGSLKLQTVTPCGLTPLSTCLIVLSLPEASSPWNTTSRPRVFWAASRS
jgi:hypothetical protein